MNESIINTLYSDIRDIIDNGMQLASKFVANTAIMTYWNIGRRIVEEEQQGSNRAQYGQRIIALLAQ